MYVLIRTNMYSVFTCDFWASSLVYPCNLGYQINVPGRLSILEKFSTLHRTLLFDKRRLLSSPIFSSIQENKHPHRINFEKLFTRNSEKFYHIGRLLVYISRYLSRRTFIPYRTFIWYLRVWCLIQLEVRPLFWLY